MNKTLRGIFLSRRHGRNAQGSVRLDLHLRLVFLLYGVYSVSHFHLMAATVVVCTQIIVNVTFIILFSEQILPTQIRL